ncbi:gamma DNA-directed DNA polymerase [Coprinellus micaceus]|uniref:Mitochondrial DNA polymerase catalytic subunit n=1 Tax=Coprinellus micaceus TaxID=71717 RepID=A0A4Y7RZ62_COPMI|nr:gamma DNA-directed DNA polymerase [Coprinellus micaceus]
MFRTHTYRGRKAFLTLQQTAQKHQRNVHVFKPAPSIKGTKSRMEFAPAMKGVIQNAEKDVTSSVPHVKRNDMGVQLLSRQLHQQIFKNASFPAPPRSHVQIAKEHLAMHGLDPSEGSVLPDTGFQLPPLQGSNLPEHFHRIGLHTAEPWLSLAKEHASKQLPPKPDYWQLQSGWMKYHFGPDGSSYFEPVDYPMHHGKPETMLTFDVETMPPYHPYPVMACAASPNAWYAWLSPWLLKETDNPEHLVPIGGVDVPRMIVGHNVSYDRQRIREEYNLEGSQNRFLDTMSLHVAVSGISSHQRPAWMKYRKAKMLKAERRDEELSAFSELIKLVEDRLKIETDGQQRAELQEMQEKLSMQLLRLHDTESNFEEAVDADTNFEEDSDIAAQRWEDVTAANSLADVAKLHCDLDINKEIRNDFMECTPDAILERVTDFLDYCAGDVHVTHEVYRVVLPTFFSACPHPISFAGILSMGSSFLPVNHEWEAYIQRAEHVYRSMQDGVQQKLFKLAMDALALADTEGWKDDPWLNQLDWTPKAAKESRGVMPSQPLEEAPVEPQERPPPSWFATLQRDPFANKSMEKIVPLLLRLSFDGHPLLYDKEERWHYIEDGRVCRVPTANGKRVTTIMSKKHVAKALDAGRLSSVDSRLVAAIVQGDRSDGVRDQILALADGIREEYQTQDEISDPWVSLLDWSSSEKKSKVKPLKPPAVMWPKWYWEATKPRKEVPPGTLDVTVRSRIAPFLLRLSWMGHPLCHSREHGWIFRVPTSTNFQTHANPLDFYDPIDEKLNEQKLTGRYQFYKLPHKDGDKANVGSPLTKTFVKYAQDGVLKSPGGEATEALDMNAVCSYWISARDRIMNQMVVWQKDGRALGFPATKGGEKWGIIVPQVVSMGTVTRRAIEKTWLTASNAKKNRVGSELKAMVRAPPGYAIVGADVDSEELWISSCMGDAQFGTHGASAIGWMTLEGTKSAGTDLHSKTAQILKISRDQAKVFNYSRIYGAGMRHAILLLLQSNPSMLPEDAQKLAENLYASTKGKNTHRADIFNRKFWFGGTESYLFNKLEEIALSDRPQTPALGCGVTHALSKEYLPTGFGSDYLPSRINWVVQSSGVDYLHLLIASMDYLTRKYEIKARYLISVHDELRYLVIEEDKYRAALALQIANLWTRSIFAYKLGMDDLPQGVAFFSAVDVDTVLRKEVFMPCVTPSQPTPIPSGESLDITQVLEKTNGGSLFRDGRSMPMKETGSPVGSLNGYMESDWLKHRSLNAAWLRAQATTDFNEIKALAQRVQGVRFEGDASSKRAQRRPRRRPNTGSRDDFDWSEMVDNLLRNGTVH